jgi:hypothetical protein
MKVKDFLLTFIETSTILKLYRQLQKSWTDQVADTVLTKNSFLKPNII